MLKKLLAPSAISVCLLLALVVLAQDLPREIDDYDNDWDTVIEQLDNAGTIDEDDGEIIFEENRLRFRYEYQDELLIPFDIRDVTNFVMGVFLELDPEEDDETCIIALRDDPSVGYLGIGITGEATTILSNYVTYINSVSVVDEENHDEAVDDEIHIIVVALENEVTVYINGKLFFSEDNFNVRQGGIRLLRSSNTTDCTAQDIWVWEIEDNTSSSNTPLKIEIKRPELAVQH